jgi:hypothetical protein
MGIITQGSTFKNLESLTITRTTSKSKSDHEDEARVTHRELTGLDELRHDSGGAHHSLHHQGAHVPARITHGLVYSRIKKHASMKEIFVFKRLKDHGERSAKTL